MNTASNNIPNMHKLGKYNGIRNKSKWKSIFFESKYTNTPRHNQRNTLWCENRWKHSMRFNDMRSVLSSNTLATRLSIVPNQHWITCLSVVCAFAHLFLQVLLYRRWKGRADQCFKARAREKLCGWKKYHIYVMVSHYSSTLFGYCCCFISLKFFIAINRKKIERKKERKWICCWFFTHLYNSIEWKSEWFV